jgi:hypothetical protein
MITSPTTSSNTSTADQLNQQNSTDFANVSAQQLQAQMQNAVNQRSMEINVEKANGYGKLKDKLSY